MKVPRVEEFSRDTSQEDRNRIIQDSGQWQIVLGTSMVDSALTFPSVKAVIDPGICRVSVLEGGVAGLRDVVASQATCTQRRGRAGRTCHGTVYRIFGKRLFETFPLHPSPEVQRADLGDLMLGIFCSGRKFLADLELMDPPGVTETLPMLEGLRELGMMNDRGTVSAAGFRAEATRQGYRVSAILNHAQKDGLINEIIGVVALLEVMQNRLFRIPNGNANDGSSNRESELRDVLIQHVGHRHGLSDVGMLYEIAKRLVYGQEAESVANLKNECGRMHVSYSIIRKARDAAMKLMTDHNRNDGSYPKVCSEDTLLPELSPRLQSKLESLVMQGFLDRCGTEPDGWGRYRLEQYHVDVVPAYHSQLSLQSSLLAKFERYCFIQLRRVRHGRVVGMGFPCPPEPI